VSGNNKKIYRQKGTGGARHGDKRAPIFVGGGVVFGPRPRDYAKKVTKSTRRLALRRVLGDLTRSERILTMDSFSVPDGKTKSFIAAVTAVTTPAKILIVAPSYDDSTYLAGRNVAWVQLVTAADVNVEQLLLAKSVILVGDALTTLANRTA
jgi:large subunit ribosomal protein L4